MTNKLLGVGDSKRSDTALASKSRERERKKIEKMLYVLEKKERYVSPKPFSISWDLIPFILTFLPTDTVRADQTIEKRFLVSMSREALILCLWPIG